MSKHTPGDWKWRESGNWHILESATNEVPILVAKHLKERDAKLIAAAPRLMSALVDAVRRIEKLNVGGPDEIPDEILEEAKAAIKKAGG